MPTQPREGSLRARAQVVRRRAGSAVTRLDVHRFLRMEPAGFGRTYRRVLKPIEGWRYRQDLAMLYFLARDVPGDAAVLEIGSYRGLSTTALALGIRERARPTALHAVDPHTGDRQDLEQSGVLWKPSEVRYRANLERAGVKELVTSHVMTSHDLAAMWDGSPLRVLFIDGWHTYEAVRQDIEDWAPLLSSSGVVVIDDYRNYDEVRQAVDDHAPLLPPRPRRAGRMWLGHTVPLPATVERLLSLRWG